MIKKTVAVSKLIEDGWKGIDRSFQCSLIYIGVVYHVINDNYIEFLTKIAYSNYYYRSVVSKDIYIDILKYKVTDAMLRDLVVTREEMMDFTGNNVYTLNSVYKILTPPHPWRDKDSFYKLESEVEV